jgi:hypothetical protein
MEVAVYMLHTDEILGMDEIGTESSDTLMPLHMRRLPHRMFEGYWDALIYQDPVKEYALRVLTGAIRKFHDAPADLVQNAWYNTALFHGPPGSGKTSLAQALAQQLSIRLSDIYPNTKLLQVDGSAVFSHMYGGTAKEIGSLFTTIHQLACDDEVEAQLVVVLIDEVEKLVPCRRSVGQKNEPMDTLRVSLLWVKQVTHICSLTHVKATAEVLTGLDKLRKSINIVWLFTTNLMEELDSAFVDRCRLKEHVYAPAANCIYDMFRAEINAKLRRGEILVDSMLYSSCSEANSASTPQGHSESEQRTEEVPSLDWACRHWLPTINTAASTLQRIASQAAGLSGRNLRGLLDVALFTYFVDEVPSLHDALVALESLVQKETKDTGTAADGHMLGDIEEDCELPKEDNGGSRRVLPIDTNIYSSDY